MATATHADAHALDKAADLGICGIRRHSSDALVAGLVHELSMGELERKYDRIKSDVGAELGSGTCGSVARVRRRDTGEEFAMKVVSMKSMGTSNFETLRMEVQMQKRLDHPNIAKVVEYFSDEENESMFMVMELCTGGSLVDEMERRGRAYDEPEAAALMSKLLSATRYCHEHGVAHRDIKLDNILYESNAPGAEPKLIDFGYACQLTEQSMTSQLGTPSYMAPELWERRAARHYDEKVDLWALGVVDYMLLSGHRPWHHESMNKKRRMIMHDPVAYPETYWGHRSFECKDFINRLLQKDPAARPDAEAALAHRWVKRHARRQPLSPEVEHGQLCDVVDSLEAFANADKLAKIALEVIAFSLPPARLEALRQIFQSMDTDGSGTLSLDEFRKTMALHTDVPPVRIAEIFNEMDLVHHGEIDYTEFLAATIASSDCIADENSVRLRNAFSMLDSQNKGYIDADDLTTACSGELDENSAIRMVNQSSEGECGRVDYPQFKETLRRAFPVLPLRRPLSEKPSSSPAKRSRSVRRATAFLSSCAAACFHPEQFRVLAPRAAAPGATQGAQQLIESTGGSANPSVRAGR